MNRDRQQETAYQYETECDRRNDDRHARKARDLARAGLKREALDEAGMLYHYERSVDLIDEVRHRAE